MQQKITCQNMSVYPKFQFNCRIKQQSVHLCCLKVHPRTKTGLSGSATIRPNKPRKDEWSRTGFSRKEENVHLLLHLTGFTVPVLFRAKAVWLWSNIHKVINLCTHPRLEYASPGSGGTALALNRRPFNTWSWSTVVSRMECRPAGWLYLMVFPAARPRPQCCNGACLSPAGAFSTPTTPAHAPLTRGGRKQNKILIHLASGLQHRHNPLCHLPLRKWCGMSTNKRLKG